MPYAWGTLNVTRSGEVMRGNVGTMDLWQVEARPYRSPHYLQVGAAYNLHDARLLRKDLQDILDPEWIIVINGPGPYNWF